MGQRPVSDLEKHISEPPQLAQAGIFHPLHERCVQKSGVRGQKSGVSILPTALCLLPTVLWFALSRCIGPRPFKSASGGWPKGLVYIRSLPLSRIKLGYTLHGVARTCSEGPRFVPHCNEKPRTCKSGPRYACSARHRASDNMTDAAKHCPLRHFAS
jgi:hypothetical protein